MYVRLLFFPGDISYGALVLAQSSSLRDGDCGPTTQCWTAGMPGKRSLLTNRAKPFPNTSAVLFWKEKGQIKTFFSKWQFPFPNRISCREYIWKDSILWTRRALGYMSAPQILEIRHILLGALTSVRYSHGSLMLGFLSILKSHYFLFVSHLDFQIRCFGFQFFLLSPACTFKLVFSKSYCNQVFPSQKSLMDLHCLRDKIQILW